MQNIGERLEEARTRMGISLREAAEATKVRTDFLQKMENNTFEEIDLPEVYRHGFLKLYGRYLKLDDEQLGTDYRAHRLGKDKAARKDSSTREFFGRMELIEQNKQDTPEQSHHITSDSDLDEPDEDEPEADSSLYWKIGAASAGSILILVLLALLVRSILSGDPTEGTATTTDTSPPAIEDNTTIADTNISTPPPSTSGQLTIYATEPTRVHVADAVTEEVLWRGQVLPDQPVTISEQGTVFLVSTNIENIQASINGGERFAFEGTDIRKIRLDLGQ